jgi:hypothetical protein
VAIADEIGLAQVSSEGRLQLAIVHVRIGDHEAAAALAQAGLDYEFASTSANLALVQGIALAHQDDKTDARRAMAEALDAADALLAATPDSYTSLDTRALALCGLAVTGDPSRLGEAADSFRRARAITRADGIVQRVMYLFDGLAACDETGRLARVRSAGTGDD